MSDDKEMKSLIMQVGMQMMQAKHDAPKLSRPFTAADFPIVANGYGVYRRTESSPICTCAEMEMAAEIAKRINRDNCVYPDP